MHYPVEMPQRTLHVPEDVDAQIDTLRESWNMSRNKVMLALIKRALDGFIPAPDYPYPGATWQQEVREGVEATQDAGYTTAQEMDQAISTAPVRALLREEVEPFFKKPPSIYALY